MLWDEKSDGCCERMMNTKLRGEGNEEKIGCKRAKGKGRAMLGVECSSFREGESCD
jgi:hypothetical protein